jgi:hypothetical protein
LRQDEMLALPIKLFIAWLVQEAAKADAEPIPDMQLLPDLRATRAPRCYTCKRFIARRLPLIGINHCSMPCHSKALALAAQPPL